MEVCIWGWKYMWTWKYSKPSFYYVPVLTEITRKYSTFLWLSRESPYNLIFCAYMVDDLAGVFQWLLYNTVQIDEKSWRRFIISDQVNVFPVVWWQAFQLFLAHTHSLSLVSTYSITIWIEKYKKFHQVSSKRERIYALMLIYCWKALWIIVFL